VPRLSVVWWLCLQLARSPGPVTAPDRINADAAIDEAMEQVLDEEFAGDGMMAAEDDNGFGGAAGGGFVV